MHNNKSLLIYCVLFLLINFMTACESENNIDSRDLFAGKYSGIEIYSDIQQRIIDTSNAVIYLKKFDSDSASLLELDLPSSSQMYYYWIVNGKIDNYGFFYHCPILEFSNDSDSLFIDWTPSLAPRNYRYIVIKEVK